jgi:hypothetical protein
VANRWLSLGLSVGLGALIYAAFLPTFGRSAIRPYIALALSLLPSRRQADTQRT